MGKVSGSILSQIGNLLFLNSGKILPAVDGKFKSAKKEKIDPLKRSLNPEINPTASVRVRGSAVLFTA